MFIKTIIKILARFLLALVALLLLLVLSLQFGKTQLLIAERVFEMLEENYDVDFQVEAIKINPFGYFKINNLLVTDHHQDTLIYIQSAEGKLNDVFLIKDKVISFSDLKLSHAGVVDVVYPGEKSGSLSIMSNKLSPKDKAKNPFEFRFKKVHIADLGYSRTKNDHRVVDFSSIFGHVDLLNVLGPNVELYTDSLSFRDVYNIKYKKLATHFHYSLSNMSFENTQIVTANSKINLDVVFDYQPEAFSDFVNKVSLKGIIKESELSLNDIDKIYPFFDGSESFTIRSAISGTLNDLRLTNTKIASIEEPFFIAGDFQLKNSIKKRSNLNVLMTDGSFDLSTNYLQKILPRPYSKYIKKQYVGVDQIKYTGSIGVNKDHFKANGEAITNVGVANIDGFVNHLNTDHKYLEFSVHDGFQYGIQQVKDLKNINYKGGIKGRIGKDHTDLKANLIVKSLQYKHIKLSNSTVDFHLNNNSFSADLESKDTLLTFTSKITKSRVQKAEEYRLSLEVTKARVNDLFKHKDLYQKNISGIGQFTFTTNPSKYSLEGFVSDVKIETLQDSIRLSAVELSLLSTNNSKTISIASDDLLEVQGRGDFNFSDVQVLLQNAIDKFVPGSASRSKVGNKDLAFKMDVYPKLIKVFTNQFWLNDNMTITGKLDSKGDKGVVYVKVPSIHSKQIKADSLEITLDNSNQWINSNISLQKLKFKQQNYQDLSLLGKKINDTLFVRSYFQSDKINNRAIFYLTKQEDMLSLGVENVYFKFLKSIWVNLKGKENKIHYNLSTGDIRFNEIAFEHKDQRFEFDGIMRKDDSKNLKLNFKKINLSEILTGIDSLSIDGVASGEVFFKEKNTLLKPNGSMVVDELKINGVNYGHLETSIEPNEKKLGYNINFNISSKDIQNIDAQGEILVNKKSFLNSEINLNVALNNLYLASLSPLGRNVLSAIRGTARGAFTINGNLNDFYSYGVLELNNAGLKFPYLNVDYNFIGNTKIELLGKKLVFNDVTLEDAVYETNGILDGEINYDQNSNWNLDFKIDSNNLLVLNTTQQEQSKYYGTGFMKGEATIKGPTTDLKIDVFGTTLPNTKFVLPLSDVKQVENNRFIYFKEQETETVTEEEEEEEEVVTVGGLSVKLNIDITKDALGEVVIDQTSGSSLQGRTSGSLIIDIDRLYNVKMYGDLVVDEGLYNFKYGGFVNKPFVVKKGGTVSWDGDPYKAELDIEAIHSVIANPKVLLENLTVNRKIDVDLITKVTGELFDSKQDFFITIPNASSTVSSELDFKLNIDENSKMRQFFSLLVTKNFYDEDNINNTSSVITNTTSEILSSAFTQIFNKKDDKFQIDLAYTSGQASSVEDVVIDDQIDIGLATEINDRILIDGKLGVPLGVRAQTAVVGEVKVEFLMNKDGSLRSTVFNRLNDIQYTDDDQGYTQGIGLNYRIDFNNISEMLKKIGFKKRNQDKAIKEEEFEMLEK